MGAFISATGKMTIAMDRSEVGSKYGTDRGPKPEETKISSTSNRDEGPSSSKPAVCQVKSTLEITTKEGVTNWKGRFETGPVAEAGKSLNRQFKIFQIE
jgi:hypothetical protein